MKELKRILNAIANSSVEMAFTAMKMNQPKLPKLLANKVEEKKD